MNIKNCKKCGRMFNYIMGDLVCPQCKDSLEEKFQEVKKFVQDNKKAAITEICEECDVDQKQVRQWIREERLIFADDSPVKINCEICGTQISTGRYCANCKKDTMNNFSGASRRAEAPAMPETPARSGAKMHTKF